jgi:hypothetical protein
MGLKHLREQNKDLNFNVIDILSKFDPTETNKMTPFLLKMFKERVKNMEWWETNDGRDQYFNNILSKLNGVEKHLTSYIVSSFINPDIIERLPKFVEFLDKGLIEQNDISKYSKADDFIREFERAIVKDLTKKSKKEVLVVHEDDEWFFIKPLTRDASVTYGYGSKWCTAMVNDPEYFYKYSYEGVLIYIFNKKTGRKFGVYSNKSTKIGIFDEVDEQIDSFETGLSMDLIRKLFDILDLNTQSENYKLFSIEEKMKSKNYIPIRYDVTRRVFETALDDLPMIPTPEEIYPLESNDLPLDVNETTTTTINIPAEPRRALRRIPHPAISAMRGLINPNRDRVVDDNHFEDLP